MSQLWVLILLAISDFIGINLATIALLWMKHVGGTLATVLRSWQRMYPDSTPSFSYVLDFYLWDALPLIYIIWALLFTFHGLYRMGQSRSRLDEAIDVLKVITLGTVLLFIATFDLSDVSFTRALVGSYWLALVGLVAGGRIVVRTLQRRLLASGIGRCRAVIVGTDERGERLLQNLVSSPAQGYEVVGFVDPSPERAADGPQRIGDVDVLGGLNDLAQILGNRSVEAVLIALTSNSHEDVMRIIEASGGPGTAVSFSITPDLYDIVTGHVRTNQIYGVPLMELQPQLMAPWEAAAKRLIDVSVAVLILGGLSPLWVLTALLIRLSSPGPILFRQERVGRNGRTFEMYKFRSMVMEAEDGTGPVWVKTEDPRVTTIGRILRALHLDEIPQCLNFLRGDMSLVGPRPERPYFVDRFKQEIPFYMRRFNLKPGLLGWAQSKHEFDLDATDVTRIAAERLEYDLYYIENASLLLDFKIMVRTIWFVLAGKSTR
ncbi:MAG: sugar transferase [Gemmatimonadetes bacterium]|nr:sugar transferase [Gemmatimonadota bacterium]